MARASETEQTGSVGVSEATGKFARIGFGFAEITRHDNGTDVFLMARDARLFDLGLTLAAQIKGGPSYFSRPEHDAEGRVAGWWFADSDGKHIDDWISHGLPFLLVVHNLDEDITYWVHVTNEAVVSTGKGKKLLIPVDQRVDEESRDELIRIAASTRAAPVWDGSAWRGADSLLDRDVLRHALLVPRLIAPHPNASRSDPLEPEQAIAMVMQARVADLFHRAESGHVPKPDRLPSDATWEWQFFAALHRRVTTGEVDHLADLRLSAPSPETAAAAAIAAAASLMEEGRADDASQILKEAIDIDTAEPIDHAWLAVQLGRAYAEIGRVDEARRLAASVQGIAATHSSDVTATAIAGAGVHLLFGLSDWGERDVAQVIEAGDTAATWWRQQRRGWALGESLARAFREWTWDRSFIFTSGDAAHDQLVAAGLGAGFTGIQGEWRGLACLLGKDMLIRLDKDSPVSEARAGLNQLLLSGEHKDVGKAATRLTLDGPALAVTEVANTLDLEHLTHTTAQAALELLSKGGKVLDPATADNAVRWLLATLTDPTIFAERVRPTFLIDHVLVGTLAAILPSATDDAHLLVAQHLEAAGSVTDQLLATDWSRVVAALAPGAWDSDRAGRMLASVSGSHQTLQDAVQRIAVDYIDSVRDELQARISQGSLPALNSWGDVTTLPATTVSEALVHLAEQLDMRRTSAASGVVTGWSHNSPHAMVVLNLNHEGEAIWEPLVAYLEDQNVDSAEKAEAYRALASRVERIPPDYHGRLAAAAAITSAAVDPLASGSGIGEATLLSAQLDVSTTGEAVAKLLRGDPRDRKWATRLAWNHAARDEGDLFKGLLLALIHDDDPAVRATAAAGLMSLIVGGDESSFIRVAVECALEDGGLLVPQAVAHQLEGIDPIPPAAQPILDRLRSHPFNAVRRLVCL